MSLSVNLILPDEQRSGSKVNLKSILRITAIILPFILLVVILQQGMRFFVIKSNLGILESRWESSEPRQTYAKKQQARLSQNLKIAQELESWKTSSPSWDSVLLAMMEVTPDEMQLTTLRLMAAAAPKQAPSGSPPLRSPKILIEGKVTEPGAMTAIEKLRDAMKNHALLKEAVQLAEVSNFAADPASENPQDRVFTIRIDLNDMPGDDAIK